MDYRIAILTTDDIGRTVVYLDRESPSFWSCEQAQEYCKKHSTHETTYGWFKGKGNSPFTRICFVER